MHTLEQIRHISNKEIAKLISIVSDTYPDIRMGQLLINTGINSRTNNSENVKNEFFTESFSIFSRAIEISSKNGLINGHKYAQFLQVHNTLWRSIELLGMEKVYS